MLDLFTPSKSIFHPTPSCHRLGGVMDSGVMDCDVVVVPWEHWVCTQCLQDNPYAVWLIKLKCFNPTHHHYPDEKTLVSIEPSTMMLVKMRPLPQCAWTIQGNCRRYPNCAKGDACTYAHSIVEQDTWNFIKTLYKGNSYVMLLCTVEFQRHLYFLTLTASL